MSVFGVDYAWGRPGAAALRDHGVKFAARYLSHDSTGKNLTHSEADELSRAGIELVCVWESTARRALAGKAAGGQDAADAARQAAACGMPAARPIYFAADWDATQAQQAAIDTYLDGAAAVIGRSRVGLYGGYGPVKRAFDAHKITFGWQTYAWSGGRWDARAQLQQYSNDHVIGGVGLDYDRAMHADFGQWHLGSFPGPNPTTSWTEKLVHNLPTVKHGDHSEAVESVQGLLIARSHPEIVVDGNFGDHTEAAVKAVQKWGGVPADGIVGPSTWPVLLRVQ